MRIERGASIAETIVVIAITSIVSALAMGVAVLGSRSANTAAITTQQVRGVGTAMNEIGRIVYAGTELPQPARNDARMEYSPAVSLAAPQRLTIYSYVNLTDSEQDPIQTTFELSGGRLRESTTDGRLNDDGFWEFSAAARSRTIANDLHGDVFEYRDQFGARIEPASGTTLSEGERRRIRSIGVTLTARHASGTHRTTVSNSFTMRSLITPWTDDQ